jgi:hypothetical protein
MDHLIELAPTSNVRPEKSPLVFWLKKVNACSTLVVFSSWEV